MLGKLVTTCVLLVKKLAVTATVGLNRDFTKWPKNASSGGLPPWNALDWDLCERRQRRNYENSERTYKEKKEISLL